MVASYMIPHNLRGAATDGKNNQSWPWQKVLMLVGRYLDRSNNFAAPDIKPCME